MFQATVLENRWIPERIKDGLFPKQVEFLCYEGREALYGGSAGGGKLLYNGTMIPTPSGFRPLSELHPGDFIFGRDGLPHAILAESELVTAPAYRLTFDDGAELIAHDEHHWLTFDRKELGQLTRLDPEWRAGRRARRKSRSCVGAGKKCNHTPEHREFLSRAITERNQRTAAPKVEPPQGTVRTTAEIVATLKTSQGGNNHAIPVAEPLELPEKALPLDPYVLGVWLGDGSSGAGNITTMDSEIVSAVEAAGFPVRNIQRKANNRAATYAHDGLYDVLKSMGLLKNKHIPHAYLWASKGQRLALLQGLLDTDGGAEETSVGFLNTRKELVEGVAHLARSLGHKVTVREGVAKLYGRVIGPKWRVSFTARMQLFRLKAKANKIHLSTRRTTRFRYIVKAERVDPIEMKCLRVASPDHLFLAGEHLIPTHNSVALLAAGLQYVDEPEYAALILRRTFKQLAKADSILAKSKEWLWKKAKWNGDEYKWTFPSGATLEFGHMEHEDAKLNYQGGAWSFVGVDEVTQFSESMITYPRTRQRRAADSLIPIRWRGASNPGGPGHDYVKGRYVKAADGSDPQTSNCQFFPATIEDNPHIDRAEYITTLKESGVDGLLLAQLLKGDWDAVQGGRFQREWLEQRTIKRGDYLICKAPGQADRIFLPRECLRFITVDPASSAKQSADWTVIAVWCVAPWGDLIWLDCLRVQKEVPDIVPLIQQMQLRWKPAFVGIEAVAANNAVLQLAQRATNPGIIARRLNPLGQDKLVRATAAMNLAATGRLWLPGDSPTFPLDDVLGELVRFTGDEHVDANDDVVDVLSYGCAILTSEPTQQERRARPMALGGSL